MTRKDWEGFKMVVGQPVLFNGGYEGRIIEVCDWSPSMVVVRTERGAVCIPFSDCSPMEGN